MKKKKQTGFFRKIFCGSKKDSCCGVEIEEVPGNKPDSKKQQTEKQAKKNDSGCECCGS